MKDTTSVMHTSALRRTFATLLTVAALTAGVAACTSAAAPSADQVVGQLTEKIDTAQMGQVITAENDPNRLLGRPNGYTSAATFIDSRVPAERRNPDPTAVENGGKVETFDSAEAAQRRMEYIQGVQQAAGPIAGTEYSYLSGASLVRVSGELTPQQAGEYEAALE